MDQGQVNRTRSGRWGAASVAATVLVVLLIFAHGALAAWPAPQKVSTGTSIGNYRPQIALDSDGNPNVVWYGSDGSTQQVYYAENTGSGWTPQKVSTGTSTSNYDPQIALDSDGNLNVVWWGWDGSTQQVYYAENTGSGWTPQSPSTGTMAGSYRPQIALDTDGNPNVVWYGWDGSHWEVYYAENTGSGWTPQKVSTGTTYCNSYPQIALDTDGNPEVVWYGLDGSTWEANWQVYYAENTGSGWTQQLVSTGTSTYNYDPQIVLDTDGNPNVVWYGNDGATTQVYYAENTGSGWTPQSLSTDTSTDNYNPQIALDSSGNPNVVWSGHDGSTDQVYYAENTGSGWTRQSLSTGTSTGNFNSQIALDTDGNPNVVWYGYDGSNHQVYYADNTGSGWTPQSLSTGTSTGNNQPQIALDTDGNPNVVWYGYDGWIEQVYYSEPPTAPALNTTTPTNVTSTTADSGGNVTDDGGDPVTARGVCWSTNPNPTTADDHTHDGTGAGTFTSDITGLTAGTAYHVRAYATNSVGTAYGNQEEFKTLTDKPGINGISPSSGPPGTQVMIKGENFGSTQDSSTVTVGGVEATAVSWTDTKIVIIIPEGTEGGAVAVTTAQGGSNTDKDFTVVLSTWYLAEGTNAWGFNTYINIENPNIEAVTARLTYLDPNPSATGKGIVGVRDVTLPPLSQTSVSSEPDIGEVDFSTTIDCLEGRTIAVDRTMYWTSSDPNLRGYHSSVGTDALSKTWYLPEGSTNWGFETWTCVLNPNPAEASVTLTYMTEVGPVPIAKTIPANSRATYPMIADVGSADASITVTSDVPVVAERSMYRNSRREGSCSIGAPAPSTDFFLAEGATGYAAGFTTYLLVQNPGSESNTITLTYNTPSGAVPGPAFEMPAGTRKTIRVNDQLPPNTDVSTTVHGSKPLVAERAMYWDAGLGECFHASIGLSDPHMVFMLPDGQVSSEAQTWTLVSNPNPRDVTVRIIYFKAGGGTPVSFTAEIPKESRATFSMADKVEQGRAAILVESLDGARPIMVERAMYGSDWGSGTDTIGALSD